MKLKQLFESDLALLNIEMLHNALANGDKAWVSYQGRVAQGPVSNIFMNDSALSLTDEPRKTIDIVFTYTKKHSQYKNAMTYEIDQDEANRISIKKSKREGFQWDVTIKQRSRSAS